MDESNGLEEFVDSDHEGMKLASDFKREIENAVEEGRRMWREACRRLNESIINRGKENMDESNGLEEFVDSDHEGMKLASDFKREIENAVEERRRTWREACRRLNDARSSAYHFTQNLSITEILEDRQEPYIHRMSAKYYDVFEFFDASTQEQDPVTNEEITELIRVRENCLGQLKEGSLIVGAHWIAQPPCSSTHSDCIHANEMKRGLSLYTDHVHVVNIRDENEAVEEDRGLTHKHLPFWEFLSRQLIFCPPKQRATFAAAMIAVQFGHVWALGNPFDVLSQSTSTSKDTTQASPLGLGKAFSMFLPTIIWSGLFLCSSICTAALAWKMPFRAPIISMLLLCLVYCFSVMAHRVFGLSVLCGSVKIPGLLFASGGALAVVLLVGFVITVVLFATWYFIPDLEKQGKVTLELE